MTRGKWRLGMARWLEATVGQQVHAVPAAVPTDTRMKDAWVEMCHQFALRMLVLAEQLRPALDHLEKNEDDPDRLQQLYHVDHGISRMRRAARDLGVLIGREGEEIGSHASSLLDVIRAAASAIEHYDRVSIGTVAELAVAAYATDDVALLLSALADNATRYSPTPVRVSAHLLGDGSVMVRMEDSGIGIAPHGLAVINNAFADPVPQVDVYTGSHTGFAVAHRLARKHGLGVRLAGRTAGGASGTIAMVTIPASLLWEIPEPQGAAPAPSRDGVAAPPDVSTLLTVGHQSPPASPLVGAAGSVRAAEDRPDSVPSRATSSMSSVTVNGLPRRQRASVRVARASSPPERSNKPDPALASQSFAADVAAFTSSGPDPSLSVMDGPGDERHEGPEGRMR